jgi:2-amino-4-hydroxy-6-hydroxymethyldihydropteridine diphosphokinase
MGRVRRFKWGPRNIDIDILLFDKCSMETEFLHLPHKEMFKRAFVIIPLKEIFNDWNLYRFPFDEIINELDDKDSVLLYKEIKD